MADYKVKHTDIDLPKISVVETEVNSAALDVPLFGRINPEYGEPLNENLLNILENFSCPEVPFLGPSTTLDYQNATPLLARTSKRQLHQPTSGQFWFNSTRDMMYMWNSVKWVPIPSRENYAANWGTMIHGQQLPRPVSPLTGHTFDYQDCIWSVSPAAFVGKFQTMDCSTDSVSRVTMQYRLAGSSTVQDGLVNYLIIGIRGNYNNGAQIDVTPTPSVTATVTPTPAASLTPTPAATQTRTPAVTTSVTPTMGVSSTPAVTPTRTQTITPTPTAAATVTPAPSSTPSATPPPIVQPGMAPTYGGGCYVRSGGTGSSITYFMSFASNGDVTEGSSLAVATPGNRGDWLGTIPGDSAANYDIMFTGSTPTGSSSSTWYNLASGRTFQWQYTLSGPSGGRNVNGTFTLRRHSDFVTIDTSTLIDVQLGINVECQ